MLPLSHLRLRGHRGHGKFLVVWLKANPAGVAPDGALENRHPFEIRRKVFPALFDRLGVRFNCDNLRIRIAIQEVNTGKADVRPGVNDEFRRA
jgi:hypothetical protein